MPVRTYRGYEAVSIGDIPKAKLLKASKTGKLSLTASELKGNRKMLMHPMNAMKIKKAQLTGSGVRSLGITQPEILTDLEWHSQGGSGLQGGSLWDTIKSSASWLYDNVLKPVGSAALDGIAQAGAQAINTRVPGLGDPLANAGRTAARNLTGMGLKKKKNSRMQGGSFMIN